MANNNDVVIINLDRPRELRFGHKALKTLCSMLGISFENLENVANNPGPEVIEKIMYCGLLSDAMKNSETLTLEQMEDLLDYASSYKEIIEKMTQAFMAALGENEEKNNQGTVTNPKK